MTKSLRNIVNKEELKKMYEFTINCLNNAIKEIEELTKRQIFDHDFKYITENEVIEHSKSCIEDIKAAIKTLEKDNNRRMKKK